MRTVIVGELLRTKQVKGRVLNGLINKSGIPYGTLMN